MVELDNIDRGILHELQPDAWNRTVQQISDKDAVSASAVRNRIDQLEEDEVSSKIDYEMVDFPLQDSIHHLPGYNRKRISVIGGYLK